MVEKKTDNPTTRHAKGALGSRGFVGLLAALIMAPTGYVASALPIDDPSDGVVDLICELDIPPDVSDELCRIERWVARYDRAGGQDGVEALATSPDGSKVFVTGITRGNDTGADYSTVAYDASTGEQIWLAWYGGPGTGPDNARALAVSPDGNKVFVTGMSTDSAGNRNFATLAYDAASGSQLWFAVYDGPGIATDHARALAVSPDGTKVFVSGESQQTSTGDGYDSTTVAYDAATGTTLWETRYDGPAGKSDWANALKTSPDGTKVFVTGQSWGTGSLDYATQGYDAATGAVLWSMRYDGPLGESDNAKALVVTPDGTKVFVTGLSNGPGGSAYATVAYDATTGSQAWVARYDGPTIDQTDIGTALAVSPNSATLFVTGASTSNTGFDYATLAYDAATGAELWTTRYDGPSGESDRAQALVVSPDGTTVFVTGDSVSDETGYDYATVAYDALTGEQGWLARYDGPASGNDLATAIAITPDGSRLLVAGSGHGVDTGADYVTVAYDVEE